MAAPQVVLIPPSAPPRGLAAPFVPSRAGGGEDARVVPVEPIAGIKAVDGQLPQRRTPPFPQPDLEDARRPSTRDRTAAEAPQGIRIPPTTHAAPPFAAQLLGQQASAALAGPELLGHRDAAALGSEAYRRAGGEPAIYSEAPAYFRLSV